MTGSRHWTDADLLWATLDAFMPVPAILAQGYCRGADYLARTWAIDHGVAYIDYPAQWYPNGVRDRAAGPKRNQRMLEHFEPDHVLAFKDRFDHNFLRGGTEHMAHISLLAGIPVDLVSHEGTTRLRLSA